jgi:hypothetical protein
MLWHTVVCLPNDEWWYHPKHVEQFLDKINYVNLHLAGYILEYSYLLSLNTNNYIKKNKFEEEVTSIEELNYYQMKNFLSGTL